MDKLYYIFGNSTLAAGLLPSKREFWNDIANDLSNHKKVRNKIKDLKKIAAAAGELGVVSHDETFKTLFHLIGQTKMSQCQDEFHALHTFRGFTGCTIGISPQRSVSQNCFMKAVHDVFGKELTSKVFFLFSDAPDRIYNAARSVFKSLIAVGEDSMHLIFRLENCWGGKRLEPSQRVLELHKKFNVACRTPTSFYNHRSHLLDSIEWPSDLTPDIRTAEQ